MFVAASLPGARFEAVRSPQAPSPLRTDQALFVCRTRRGPLDAVSRIDSWRQFAQVFGGYWSDSYAAYAVKGYFENGGDIGFVVRVGTGGASAFVDWVVDPPAFAASAGFASLAYRWSAGTAGTWADGLAITVAYRRDPALGPLIDLTVTPRYEPEERLLGLTPMALVDRVNSESQYVRIAATGAAPPPPLPGVLGPRSRSWAPMRMAAGQDPVADVAAYLSAVANALREPEAALYALPDLHPDLPDPLERAQVLGTLAQGSAERLDRMILADLPEPIDARDAAAQWLADFGQDPLVARSVAAYHPWLNVADPLGGVRAPHRAVPPCGHVAGVYSRLDRERGAYFTPANAPMTDAFDGARYLPRAVQAALVELGINPIRCHSGRGMMIWGGRMLRADDAPVRFVAHRRLIHRLVRAVRRVAEPLAFTTNGPELWFALTRAATTLLLEAFRAGTLKGNRPEEAFQVRCNKVLNPPAMIDAGRVLCEIQLAPAAPMEFITIRVALTVDGTVEVVEP